MTVDGEEATVYLATGIADASRIKSPHLTLPDLIRRTPQGRGRVILIKSMQVFTGALDPGDQSRGFRGSDQAL